MAVLWAGRTCIFVHIKADVLSTQSTGVDRVKLLIMHRLCLIGQLVSPFRKHIYRMFYPSFHFYVSFGLFV